MKRTQIGVGVGVSIGALVTALFTWGALAASEADAGASTSNGDDAAATPTTERPTGESSELEIGGPPRAGKAKDVSRQPSPLNPAKEEFPGAHKEKSASALSALMSDATALRGRVAAVTSVLYKSKIQLSLAGDGAEYVDEFVVKLDGGVVFVGGRRHLSEDARVLHQAGVAPGRHQVELSIKRVYSKSGFASWQRSQFVVEVPEGKTLDADFEVQDDSDMHQEFPQDQEGTYELNLTFSAQVRS